MPYYFFIIAGFFAQIIMALIHWGFYKIAVSFFQISNPNILLPLKIILGFLSFSFIIASVLVSRFDNIFVRVIYIAAVFWMGLLFYLFIAAGIIWLILTVGRLFPVFLNSQILAQIFFTAALIVSVCGVINATNVRVKKLEITLPNLPASWQGKTAVWVSDTHLGAVRNYGFAVKIANMIQDLHPDMIFIGGDLYDGVASDLDKLVQPFVKLSAPQGIYFITGNHEEFTSDNRYIDVIKRTGIKYLDNEMINLDGLQIIGLNYRDTSGDQNYKSVMSKFNINQNLPSILLKHSPGSPEIAKNAGISLQLSGHTHQGQIFPVGIIDHLIWRGFDYGLKKLDNLIVYTSGGAGTWGPPMRVGTMPDIVLIQFNKDFGQNQVCFKDNCFAVELAKTPEQQSQGLMFRETLAANQGMLFIFKEEGIYPFWMKNTLIPLDIIWLDKNKSVVFISENTQSCEKDICPSIYPTGQTQYVLELNGGTAKKIGLSVGDNLSFNLGTGQLAN